ncbi:MAG: BON domain-containing protein [Planctomycetaceae bacterium]|nr:MAG: BON domain-containing protein [Planctomycetaceae bacterium]
MRRLCYTAAILLIAAGAPVGAQAGDREIAQTIIGKLKVHRDSGSLKDFTLDLKVNDGVVLLRGSVAVPSQKSHVLSAAEGVEGVLSVVDEIEVRQAANPAGPAAAQKADGLVPSGDDSFSMRQALNARQPSVATTRPVVIGANGQGVAGRSVRQATATDTETGNSADAEVTSAVVATLGAAQRQGKLRGFGVDVNTRDGVVYLNGRASSDQQREMIVDLVRDTSGVFDVVEEITVVNVATAGQPAQSLEPLPMALPSDDGFGLNSPSNQAAASRPGVPARTASTRMPGAPAQTAPYQMNQAMPTQPVSMGMPAQGFSGHPVPMAPYAGAGAGPRYEQPYLPNYAWPGYASYPNYAAVSYPQQYSPSAFPYIGPFYPYPQVPLGWRKVSLEWDDGWWFLDFTDR